MVETRPTCARRKRRNVVAYSVPEEVKRLVLLNRWKSGVCPSCFDELAEAAGVAYTFDGVEVTSWSQLPHGRRRR